MRDGKGPSEKVMGRVSRVPLRVVIPIGVALLVVMMIVSVGTGPVGLGVGAIMRVIVHEVLGVGHPQPQLETTVVMTLRLPRVLFGVLVGAALAVSGASLQSLLRNPLAGPGIIGVSGGASMGAVAAIVLLPSLSGIAVAWVVPAAAFLGGLLVTSVIYALARPRAGSGTARLLLVGIAIGSAAAAVTGFLTYAADDDELQTVVFWQMGSLGHLDWIKLAVAAPSSLAAASS